MAETHERLTVLEAENARLKTALERAERENRLLHAALANLEARYNMLWFKHHTTEEKASGKIT